MLKINLIFIMMFTFIMFFLNSLFMMLYFIFCKNEMNLNMNFSSMYECGFMNMTFSRFFFSMNMFTYLILFIVLDMEIFILSLMLFYEMNFMIILNMFVFSMIMLMMFEWFSMSLNWFI